MTTSVLVTRQADNHYTARALMIPDVVAIGATEDEAIMHLRTTLSQLQQHSRVIEVDLPLPSALSSHSWQRFAGMWQSDPDWDAFLQAMADSRAHDATDGSRA